MLRRAHPACREIVTYLKCDARASDAQRQMMIGNLAACVVTLGGKNRGVERSCGGFQITIVACQPRPLNRTCWIASDAGSYSAPKNSVQPSHTFTAVSRQFGRGALDPDDSFK